MILADSISIHAPLSVVWRETVDVERWPEWTPTVTASERLGEGPLRVGSEVRLRQPGQPAAVWTVTSLDPLERFSWETQRPGLRMTATHALASEGDGTRNALNVEITGALSVLLWPVLRVLVSRALALENRGLKARCEALAA